MTNHANAGVPGWASVGQTEGDGDLRLAGLKPGVHVYKARTDKLTAEPVSVTVPMACADDTGWKGSASIIDGSLVLPKGATGFVRFYLSVDGHPAVRVPLSQDEQIVAGLVTPVAYALPPLSGKRLDLEVWRASDSDTGPLFPVAKGSLDVPEGKTLTSIVGEPSGLTLKVSTPDNGLQSNYKLGEQDTPLGFEWTASSDRVNEVMWQITTGPHATADHEFVPDDLIAAGTSQLSSAAGPGTRGEFTINSQDIPGRKFTGGEAVYQDSLKSPATLIKAAVTPAGINSLPKQSFGAVLSGSKVPDEAAAAANVVDLPSFGDPVYVRVMAKPQGPAVGSASSNVRIELPVPQGQKGKPVQFKYDSSVFDPGRRPNSDLAACAAVIVPWNGSGLTIYTGGQQEVQYDPTATPPPGGWTPEARFTSGFYPTSRTYCPSDFPPPETCDDLLCDIWDGIVEATSAVVGVLKDFYGIAAATYNGIIDFAVKTAGDLGLCEVVGAVADDDGATQDCKTVLKTMTRVAITVVLAYFGLPAKLPTLEELDALAEGELAILAVELMKYYGVPCDELKSDPEAAAFIVDKLGEDPAVGEAAADPCLALAKYFIAKVRAEVEDKFEAGIAATTGLPSLAGIPGASMKLDPKGQYTPAKIDLVMSVAKSNADASGQVCTVTVQPRVPRGKGMYTYPIQSEVLQLSEVAPLDGTGQWRGNVVLANTNEVEGRNRYFKAMEAYVKSAPGSFCDIEPFVIGPKDLAPKENN